MKKLRNMKKNNKGFSLVELIVVIAIMVVLVAVLGSTILGYIEDANHGKDMQALDSVKTALTTYVAEGGDDTAANAEGVVEPVTLQSIITGLGDDADVITDILSETFGDDATFNASSDAFEGIQYEHILVVIQDGAVSVCVPVNADEADDFDAYTAGTFAFTDAQQSVTITE